MNYKTLLSFILPFLIFSCTPSPEKQAEELIEKSIKAHELSKKWKDVASVKFKRSTRILDENGTVESESEHWLEFRLKPYYEGKMSWEKDSVLHVANFNGSKMSYQMGENTIQNEGFLKAKKSEINAAYFAFAQPWNLMDENTWLSYEGQKTLEDGKKAESVRVDFGVNSDVRWFYFDQVSDQILANELHTKDHKALIENTSYDDSTGLLLPKVQKSYRTDDTGKKLFLRAEYLYSDYQVTLE
ncbi:hypothetical protein J2X69_003738 [Algoriphagus sp. 4150]|uniref:hypothetical protein n=1 Tax=Algoriphagus sp. 4150 TaxID=2817756 RepID=UPI00285A6D19|nr:hypothetical protein [Algoriphagus sp. 4150]MDR7131374.1 hypothetical protein [Algoriphagus sp. 4150]